MKKNWAFTIAMLAAAMAAATTGFAQAQRDGAGALAQEPALSFLNDFGSKRGPSKLDISIAQDLLASLPQGPSLKLKTAMENSDKQALKDMSAAVLSAWQSPGLQSKLAARVGRRVNEIIATVMQDDTLSVDKLCADAAELAPFVSVSPRVRQVMTMARVARSEQEIFNARLMASAIAQDDMSQ